MRKKDRDEDDEANDADDSLAADSDSPEYQFAGYNVEFSEKIVLTPPALQQKGAAMS